MEAVPRSEIETSLQAISQASDRAALLCQQMLAYAGKGRLTRVPIDLSSSVEETVRLVYASLGKPLAITMDRTEGLPAVSADPGQLQQALLNLLTNAAESLGDDLGSVHIRTRLRTVTAADFETMILGEGLPPGQYVVVEIEDTGCGVEPTILPRICDPFFTTKFQGRGLGLAATMGILRAHQLRQLRPRLPVVMMSGYNEQQPQGSPGFSVMEPLPKNRSRWFNWPTRCGKHSRSPSTEKAS